jgi:hypothetical protein
MYSDGDDAEGDLLYSVTTRKYIRYTQMVISHLICTFQTCLYNSQNGFTNTTKDCLILGNKRNILYFFF